jgi:hypothetical protein
MANLQIHPSHKDKVILSILSTSSQEAKNEMYYNWTMPEKIELTQVKNHQLVIGANSWDNGKTINFIIDGKMFCPSLPAQAVQRCNITLKQGAISVRIDNRTLQKTEVLVFVKNEGYADLDKFKEAYFKAYSDEHVHTIVRKCTLIHWTNLVY